MLRFGFYILTALLTFVIGSFIVFKFYIKSPNPSEYSEKYQNSKVNVPPTLKVSPNFLNTENKLFSNEYNRENRILEKKLCKDKRILPVWNELMKDKDFTEGGSYGESGNCSDMFEVKYIDLNRDGQKEILLRGKNFNVCGATGNCGFWVFHKTGKIYRKILADSDYVDITEMGNQLKKSSTKGFRDILLKSHLSASDTAYSTYKFDGRNYKETKCMVEACVVCTGENPKWEFISWQEYEKRQRY